MLKVNALAEIDEDDFQYIAGKVLSVDINDHYSQDKGEPIYISVSIDPLEELNDNIDPVTLATIPLHYITKY